MEWKSHAFQTKIAAVTFLTVTRRVTLSTGSLSLFSVFMLAPQLFINGEKRKVIVLKIIKRNSLFWSHEMKFFAPWFGPLEIYSQCHTVTLAKRSKIQDVYIWIQCSQESVYSVFLIQVLIQTKIKKLQREQSSQAGLWCDLLLHDLMWHVAKRCCWEMLPHFHL